MVIIVILSLYALFLIIVATLFTVEVYYLLVKKYPPNISTERRVRRLILDALPHNSNLTYIEVGCGSGNGLMYMAAQRPEWKCIGYEVAPRPYLLSVMNRFFQKKYNVKILRQDFLKADLSLADIIYCYLFDTLNRRLEKQLFEQCRPGTIVVSYAFSFHNLTLLKSIPLKKQRHSQVYVYKV